MEQQIQASRRSSIQPPAVESLMGFRTAHSDGVVK